MEIEEDVKRFGKGERIMEIVEGGEYYEEEIVKDDV